MTVKAAIDEQTPWHTERRWVIHKDGAQYEVGYDWASSIDAMVKEMTDKSKTVEDLAKTVDDVIFFYKEVKP